MDKKLPLIILISLSITSFFLLFTIFENNDSAKTKVINYSLTDNNYDVSIDQVIELEFNKRIEIENIKILIKPEVKFSTEIDDNSLQIYPNLWIPSSKYTIQIFDKNAFLDSFEFFTRSVENLSESELLSLSVYDMRNLSNNYSDLLLNKPWIRNFPINNEDYFIFYNINSDKIIIKINNSNELSEEEQTYIQNEIEDLLHSFKVPSEQDTEVF